MSREAVQQAERDLVRVLEQSGCGLDPKELREQAREGCTWAVVDMAFWRLVNRNELELDGRLVRAAARGDNPPARDAAAVGPRSPDAALGRIGSAP